MPLRLDSALHAALSEGTRRTPHKKQELIRLTLRLHLREVIDREAAAAPVRRITNIKPWPRRVVEKAYQRIGAEWDKVEDAAIRAQGTPDFND